MSSSETPEHYAEIVRRMALDESSFVQMTLKGRIRGEVPPAWRMITVRPVEIRSRRHLQFSYFDARQDITKNYAGEEAVRKLDEALAIPFSAIHVRTTLQDLRVQLTRKGKAILHYGEPSVHAPPDLAHDAAKDLPLPAGRPDAYLQAVGIMNSQGQVRPEKRPKFTQVNEFLKLLEHTGELDRIPSRPVRIVDFGCGSAYLTLAAYHYLNNVRGIPARLDGVDTNAALIDKNNAGSRRLGYDGACFYASAIRDYTPESPPDIVMALHACDTATDDALAQGLFHGARLILAAPCCHHHLHTQLHAVDPMRPIMRHGILKQRLGDILTDSFRALVLRIYGYSTDVIEFVASEHTDRNLMIRAVKRDPVDTAAFVREYQALKAFWNVRPYLEDALGESFAARLEQR